MTTQDPTQPMTPRLPDETEGTDPPGTKAPTQPIDDPPEEGPPGASTGEDPPPPFEPDVPRPGSSARRAA